MNKDLIIEALEALIEKKTADIAEISLDNNYHFSVWTALIDYIGQRGGKKEINEATAMLNADHKKRLQRYIDENAA